MSAELFNLHHRIIYFLMLKFSVVACVVGCVLSSCLQRPLCGPLVVGFGFKDRPDYPEGVGCLGAKVGNGARTLGKLLFIFHSFHFMLEPLTIKFIIYNMYIS